MSRKSFLTCPHKNVQEFSECCLDCGYNIYMTREEYIEKLRKEIRSGSGRDKEVRSLERQLGIKK